MNKKTSQSGFTLVEILVSSAILIMVVLVAANMYLTATAAERRAYGKQNALDSTRFALEVMGRAIRQSTIQTISSTQITILHPDPDKCGGLTLPCSVEYRLASGRIQERVGSAGWSPITANDVQVETLRFTGNTTGSGVHPRITIALTVRSKLAKATEDSRVRLQTTITSRVPE